MTQRTNEKNNPILMVVTSHGDLGGVRPTGLFVSEAAEPWQEFTDAGYPVTVVSVEGGAVPLDGYDETDEVQRAFVEAYDLSSTQSVADVDPADYVAVMFPGGHGTMWDFPTAPVGQAATAAWSAGSVVAAVCHGPAVLSEARDEGGHLLVEGRNVTGFSNAEEAAVELTDVVPFLLEDRLGKLGGRYTSGPVFTDHVVTDGRLITGQNPQSARSVARAIIEQLGAR